jgi:hypothetical protein
MHKASFLGRMFSCKARSQRTGIADTQVFLLVASLSVLVLGCQPVDPVDPRMQEIRGSLMMDEPAEAKPLSAVSEGLTAGEEVILIGRVFANGLSPFDPGKATFVLSELPEEGHSDDPDHADNCPFCKRKAAQAPKALVQFVDDKGDVLAVDAKKLFDLKEKDVVVVRGRGQLHESGMYFVTAQGIAIRR